MLKFLNYGADKFPALTTKCQRKLYWGSFWRSYEAHPWDGDVEIHLLRLISALWSDLYRRNKISVKEKLETTTESFHSAAVKNISILLGLHDDLIRFLLLLLHQTFSCLACFWLAELSEFKQKCNTYVYAFNRWIDQKHLINKDVTIDWIWKLTRSYTIYALRDCAV